MTYIISQILSGVSALLFLYSILQRNNKKMFVIGALQNLADFIKCLLLGGFSGAVIQVFSGIRSISKAYRFFSGALAWGIIAAQIIFGVIVNKNGYIGYLPIVASVGYSLLLMKTEHNLVIKYGLAANALLWATYNLSIRDYVGAVTNLIYALVTFAVTISQSRSRQVKNSCK